PPLRYAALRTLSLPHPRPTTPTLLPYTTLFRSPADPPRHHRGRPQPGVVPRWPADRLHPRRPGRALPDHRHGGQRRRRALGGRLDRKSTSELQSRENLVCRLLLEKKKKESNTDE